jgi:hypothetical protein
MKEKF